jgi:hypothetical protein
MSNVDEICLMHEKVLRQQVRKQTLEEVLKEIDEAFFKERGDWDIWFDEHNKKKSDKDVYIENIETLQRVIDDITKRLEQKLREMG